MARWVRKRLAISLAARCFFAGYDVINVANRKVFYVNMTLPGSFKRFDPVGRKYEIQVERTVLELHKIFATFNLARLLID